MTDFADLKELVKKKGFGSTLYKTMNGEEVYLTRGVKEIFLADDEKEQQIMNIVARFQKQDFGNAAEFGKESRPGHEYGRYEITDFNTDEDSAVWIHRTENAIKVYFKFER